MLTVEDEDVLETKSKELKWKEEGGRKKDSGGREEREVSFVSHGHRLL
jgi:hypothetical protein